MRTPGDPSPQPARSLTQRTALWFAQGFGLGRIALAPGTWGSVLGLAWGLALFALGGIWALAAGGLVTLVLSIPVCGAAERMLERRDPPSVVFDEAAAMPWSLGGWLLPFLLMDAPLDSAGAIPTLRLWLLSAGAFLAFRVFDIAKPWPVHVLQRLPGGWGIVLDDAMAAVYSAVVGLGLGFWLR